MLWTAEQRQRRLEYMRGYARANRDAALMRLHEWRVRNRAKQVRKAVIGAPGFSSPQWSEMKEVWGDACAYCLRQDRPLTLDHVEPISRGGEHDESNIVPACRQCNSRKKQFGILRMVDYLSEAA